MNMPAAVGGWSAVNVAGEPQGPGRLIVNADDWGQSFETTERIFDCVRRGTVSSASAMVFMEDSERAAARALENGVDAGLHLNLTTPFSAPGCPARLVERQHELAAYLRRHRLAQVIFHPGLRNSFKYVVAAQLDEFSRIYRTAPARIDGHHHMHLCANVLLGNLLPPRTIVRRNPSFLRREKSLINRSYRRTVDQFLARRHRVVDFFFTLAPVEPLARVQRIFSLSRDFVVEVETHPVEPEEYLFLTREEVTQIGTLQIARKFDLS